MEVPSDSPSGRTRNGLSNHVDHLIRSMTIRDAVASSYQPWKQWLGGWLPHLSLSVTMNRYQLLMLCTGPVKLEARRRVSDSRWDFANLSSRWMPWRRLGKKTAGCYGVMIIRKSKKRWMWRGRRIFLDGGERCRNSWITDLGLGVECDVKYFIRMVNNDLLLEESLNLARTKISKSNINSVAIALAICLELTLSGEHVYFVRYFSDR